MAILHVNLLDPADVRTGIDILNRQLNITSHSPQTLPLAEPQQPLMKTMMEMKQKEAWRFLYEVANLKVPEYSLPELGEHLGKPSNKVGSLKAILAKPEQRLGVQFFELAPSGAVDAAGNPRYRMPDTIKRAIQAAAHNIQSVRDIIVQCNDFAHLTIKACNQLVRPTEYAVRTLWNRTLAKADAFAPHQPQSELLEFLDRHPRLVKAVKHIFENDVDGAIRRYLSPGTASAMLYMMAASKSDAAKYREANRAEKALDMSRWDKACEFWTALALGAPEVDQLRYVRQPLEGDRDEYTGHVFAETDAGSVANRTGAIIKAWGHFLVGKNLTTKNCELRYTLHDNDDGTSSYRLDEFPTIGGIDLGEPAEAEVADGDE
jgi:hypothetical protein